jgi:hypothetical protein
MADKCRLAHSSWVNYYCLVNGQLVIDFKSRRLGSICVAYAGDGQHLFDVMDAASSKGHFVHTWLYHEGVFSRPYQVIASPCGAILFGVSTPCCPGQNVPRTLHITLSGSSDPACGGSFPIVYDDASGHWLANVTVGSCANQNFDLSCDSVSTLWSFNVRSASATLPSSSCQPFLQVWDITSAAFDVAGCCASNITRATITP